MTATTLQTERLSLRPLVKATQRNVDWVNNPVVVQCSERRHFRHTLAHCQRYIASFRGRSAIWGIHLIETGQHIGNVTAMVDDPNNVADMGIMIGETEFWGHGLGTEAWRAARDWLLDPEGGGLRKLEGGCMANHLAMRHLFDVSGFSFEGERKNHFLFTPGTPVGMVLYGKFK